MKIYEVENQPQNRKGIQGFNVVVVVMGVGVVSVPLYADVFPSKPNVTAICSHIGNLLDPRN
jgi:hypothetical protein